MQPLRQSYRALHYPDISLLIFHCQGTMRSGRFEFALEIGSHQWDRASLTTTTCSHQRFMGSLKYDETVMMVAMFTALLVTTRGPSGATFTSTKLRHSSNNIVVYLIERTSPEIGHAHSPKLFQQPCSSRHVTWRSLKAVRQRFRTYLPILASMHVQSARAAPVDPACAEPLRLSAKHLVSIMTRAQSSWASSESLSATGQDA